MTGEREPLNYAGVLSALTGLMGQSVNVGISGADRSPPLVASFDGKLENMGWQGTPLPGDDPEDLTLMVGDVSLKLYPGHFVEASRAGVRLDLYMTFGKVRISIAGSARRAPLDAD
jgi:hypothetical protein